MLTTAWLAAGLLVAAAAGAAAQAADPALGRELAPSGRLRAAINTGNPVLAGRDSEGKLAGVSVDVAREIARRTGLPLDLVPFDAAGKVTDSAAKDVWDVAFLAVDPKRAGEIDFTAPYVVIEGAYAVPDGSGIRTNEEVDREGVRVAVGRGSAYDLYLTRTLGHATLVRAPTSADVGPMFVRDGLEVAANVRQPLARFVAERPGFRMLPGRFMEIEQAVGLPKGRALAARFVADTVEELKRSGFIAEALARHGQGDAAVAPPAGR